MHCGSCTAEVPVEARFCPACGAEVPVEDPAAVASYCEALAKLGGRSEGWARAELDVLRAELGIRPETHDRLMAELAPVAAAAPIGAWIDAGPIADFRATEQCFLRFRIQNRADRPIAALDLRAVVSAADAPLQARSEQVLGPGDDEVLAVWFRPEVAGHHRVDLEIGVVPLRGEPTAWAAPTIPFLIGAAPALQQRIHIDARTQRVGVFENIGAASRGGLVTDADWRPLALRPAVAAVPPLDGLPAGPAVAVGPGDDLAAAIRRAPAGARIEVRGAHRGPITLERPLSLVGLDGATITAEQGPVIRITADVAVTGLTVRGAAPPGRHAADGIEARSGQVVLDGCTVSADAPGNLVPGRAVAVVGPASVELRGCQLEGSGIGVAVDVSWSGFATDTARGARVRLLGCEVVGVGTGVAVAGADREVHVVKTRFAGVGEAAVRVLGAAACAVEGCPVPRRLMVADPGAKLTVTG